MQRKQWALSAILFLISLSFLVFSKNLFPPGPAGSKLATALPSTPAGQREITLLANRDYYPFLKQHFHDAKQSILGTVYLFKMAPFRDNEPADLLYELIAARKRNVRVDLVIERSSDIKDYNEANGHAADLLRKAGVKIRVDDEMVTTHSKTFVIDGRYCFVGSHNFTHAALSMNEELSLFVDSQDLGAQITRFVNQIPLSKAQ